MRIKKFQKTCRNIAEEFLMTHNMNKDLAYENLNSKLKNQRNLIVNHTISLIENRLQEFNRDKLWLKH